MTSKEWSMIDAEARHVIEDYLKEIPVKLGAMARDLGIIVKLSTLKPGESGKISRENGQYIIRINRHETRARQRFTLAHEIAHFLLHRDLVDSCEGGITDNVLYRSGVPEQKEFEANRLAADLIMPMSLVRSKLESIGEPLSEEVIDYMADMFQVSNAAMEIRLSP